MRIARTNATEDRYRMMLNLNHKAKRDLLTGMDDIIGFVTQIQYSYDALGRSTSRMLDERFFYRGYLQVAAYDWLPVTKTSRCFLVWDPTQSVATRPLAIRTGGTAYAYGWDLTKNICELYGPNGYIVNRYAYTPFGSVTQTEGSVNQPFTWSSEYHDTETGLVYYNYRYYNPHDSRWTRRDPISRSQGNRNLYSSGNRTYLFDYLGLLFFDKCLGKMRNMGEDWLKSKAADVCENTPTLFCKELYMKAVDKLVDRILGKEPKEDKSPFEVKLESNLNLDVLDGYGIDAKYVLISDSNQLHGEPTGGVSETAAPASASVGLSLEEKSENFHLTVEATFNMPMGVGSRGQLDVSVGVGGQYNGIELNAQFEYGKTMAGEEFFGVKIGAGFEF